MDVFVCGVSDKKRRLQLIELPTRHLAGCFEVPLKKKKSLAKTQAEKKKASPGDDGHGNPEIERLRKEVQDTKEMNRKLRDLLQVSLGFFVFTALTNVAVRPTTFFIFFRVPGAPRSVVGRREAQSLHGRAGVGETGQGGRPV